MAELIVLGVLVAFALFVAAKTIRIIPQARAGVVERLGRYSRTLNPGLTIVVPFIVVLYFWFENINRLLPPNL